MVTSKQMPLVSVGIPTYNRPQGLQQTLECITTQSYPNLEIIVSDNCSGGEETHAVVQSFMENDIRIKFYRQDSNLGAIKNFQFVLEESSGEYFMWAADDDDWEPSFIETCLNHHFQLGNDYAVVSMEAQYFYDAKKFPFFQEATPFYSVSPDEPFARIGHMLEYNFGNLFYGLYRKSVLFNNKRSFFTLVRNRTPFNEIALLVFVAAKGKIRVLPEIGIYKRLKPKACLVAKWEKHGGILPHSKGSRRWRRLPNIFQLHMSALKGVIDAINLTDLNKKEKKALRFKARKHFLRHFTFYITLKKPKSF